MNVLYIYIFIDIYIYIYMYINVFLIYILNIYTQYMRLLLCCMYCIYICTYQPRCVVALLSVVVDCVWLVPRTHSCKTDVFTTHRCLHI